MQTTVTARILPLSSRDKLEVPTAGNRGETAEGHHVTGYSWCNSPNFHCPSEPSWRKYLRRWQCYEMKV
jgi:hypothetical protein